MGVDFERHIKHANVSLPTTNFVTGQATAELSRAAGNVSQMHYGLIVMGGLGAAALTIGFWVWLSTPSVPPAVDSWATAEALQPALIEAITTAKEPAWPAKSKLPQPASRWQPSPLASRANARSGCGGCWCRPTSDKRGASKLCGRLVRARPEAPWGLVASLQRKAYEQALLAWEIANGVSKRNQQDVVRSPWQSRILLPNSP